MSVKKTLISVASYALVGALAVGGTVAFLQDEESAMNTLAVGDAVDIVINEYQRSDGDNSPLEEFDQGKVLYPIKGSAQGAKDKYGMPTADAAKNYVDKIVTVENTGQADAYIRVFVAIPTELLGESVTDSGDDVLHWSWGNRVDTDGNYPYEDETGAGKEWSNKWSALWAYGETAADPDFKATIDGQEYVVSTFYMKEALKPTEESRAVMAGLYLDKNVDYDNGQYMLGDKVINYDLSKGVNVPIFADAVEATGATGETYKTAFANRPADEVFTAWAEKVDAPVLAESAEELTAALAEGGTIYLKEGTYTLPADISGVNLVAVDEDVVIALEAKDTDTVKVGDNVTIKGIDFVIAEGSGIGKGDAALLSVAGENVVIEDCTFDISGTNCSAIEIGGGSSNTVIKNCDFTGGYKHIGPGSGTPGDITIENCTFGGTNSTYAMHLNVTSNDVLIKDCEVSLFNTFYGTTASTGTLTFENCDFVCVEGKTNVVKTYRDVIFNNCVFEDGFLFSDYDKKNADHNITVTTVGGSWGEGSIKEHFLDDSFVNTVTGIFDGETFVFENNEWTAQD